MLQKLERSAQNGLGNGAFIFWIHAKHLNGPENEAFSPFLAIAGLQKMETLLIYHVFRAYFKDSKSPKSEERVKQLTQYNADLEQRKILYKSKEWQRLRYKFLRENPRCVDCGQPTLWTM